MGLVQRAAVVAGTGGPATALLDARRGGRQHGSGRHQLLQSAVEHPADLRRVARDTHRGAPGTSGKKEVLPAEARKTRGAKKKKSDWRGEAPQQRLYS